jgi:uncharacterized protein with GYD domain
MGAYDIVAIMQAPDDETATATAANVSSLGNVGTTSLRSFGMDEIERIIKKSETGAGPFAEKSIGAP